MSPRFINTPGSWWSEDCRRSVGRSTTQSLWGSSHQATTGLGVRAQRLGAVAARDRLTPCNCWIG
jgi:hypothetical protein